MVAACLALVLIGGGFGVFAIAAEAVEYREAVTFFTENKLSTEGLTRSEIKAVYHDINMKTFSYAKTAEVLNTLSVELHETDLGFLDKDSLAAFWASLESGHHNNPNSNNKHTEIWYEISYENIDNVGPLCPIVECYEGENLIWNKSLKVFSSVRSILAGDNIVLYGSRDQVSALTGWAYAIMLDKNGNVIWEHTSVDEGSSFDAGVVSEDGFTFFGHVYDEDDGWSSTFTLMDTNGNIKTRTKSDEAAYVCYDSAIKIGDSYLAKTATKLVSFSADGNATEARTYFDGDRQYVINDMLYHDGKVWISAYKQTSEDDTLQSILDLEKNTMMQEIDLRETNRTGIQICFGWSLMRHCLPAMRAAKSKKFIRLLVQQITAN